MLRENTSHTDILIGEHIVHAVLAKLLPILGQAFSALPMKYSFIPKGDSVVHGDNRRDIAFRKSTIAARPPKRLPTKCLSVYVFQLEQTFHCLYDTEAQEFLVPFEIGSFDRTIACLSQWCICSYWDRSTLGNQ